MVAEVGEDESWTWREQRLRAIEQHARAYEEHRAMEATKARKIVEEFARDATTVGLAVTPLIARPYHGRAKYRTRLRGWYVHPNFSLAVGTDGSFYQLHVLPSIRSWLCGVVVEATDPPLIIGEGGRDGEAIPLRTLLRRRLESGDMWP